MEKHRSEFQVLSMANFIGRIDSCISFSMNHDGITKDAECLHLISFVLCVRERECERVSIVIYSASQEECVA